VQGYQAIVELIDLRSFSNLWFWIALAVVWSTASHWVMGVPWDMVQRARRRGGPVLADVETLARINARRVLHIVEVGGVWASALLGFVLSMLAVLGFGFGIEFCQALFLLALPMSLVTLQSVRSAQRIATDQAEGDALLRRLRAHRRVVQVIGFFAIFVTGLWGMWQNLTRATLGL
jgi:hypothetical protein